MQAVYSSEFLNGYCQLCEDIASSKNMHLVNAIESESKNLVDIMRFVVYTLLLVFVFVYIKKKYWKTNEKN